MTEEVYAWLFTWFACKHQLFPLFDQKPESLPDPATYRGLRLDEARAEIGQVVEGLTTAAVLRDLAHRLGIEMPITEGVSSVLEGRPLSELAAELMGRRPTEE